MTVANGEDVDTALVAKIRDGEEPEIHPFEPRKLVEQVSLAKVDEVPPDGDSFKVTLRVLGATTVHLLKVPSATDVFEYRPILYKDVSGGCSVCRSAARR